jgi:signal transduction histidine kinase
MGNSAVRSIELRAISKDDCVLFEIEDSGPGVPKELEEKAFQPFVRGPNAAGQPGLGLGLATVKRLVTAHGGQVGARPAGARGTVFWFTLPRAQAVSQAT